MTLRWHKVLAGLLVFWILSLAVASSVAASMTESTIEWGPGLGIIGIGLVGAVLIARRPENAVSWVLGGVGFSAGLTALSAGLAQEIADPEPWQVVWIAIGGLGWVVTFFLALGVFPLLFPDGSPPTPRWRWILWVGVPATTVAGLLHILQEQVCARSGPEGCVEWAANPVGISGVPNAEYGTLGSTALYVVLIAIAGAVVSLFVRLHRSRGVERQQLKWLTFTLGALIAWILIVDVALGEIGGIDLPLYDLYLGIIWAMVPLSAAVAILRYRLYEIDRIINRTVVYSSVVVVLGLVYAGSVFILRESLPLEGDLAVAASTLAVAALFNPVRRRLQVFVDKRFYRSRYQTQAVVEQFAGRLRDQVDLYALTAELRTTVADSLHPDSVTVWLRLAGRDGRAPDVGFFGQDTNRSS